MEPPSCKHTRWPVGLLMLVAMVLMQMMVLVMIDHMKLIKIFEISYLGLVILWQFYCISIFLGSSFNLIFRGTFLCPKILGQLLISIFWGRFFNSIFWGNFFGSQYSGATFCKHSHSRLNWVSRLVGQFVKSRGDQRQHFQDFLTPLF